MLEWLDDMDDSELEKAVRGPKTTQKGDWRLDHQSVSLPVHLHDFCG